MREPPDIQATAGHKHIQILKVFKKHETNNANVDCGPSSSISKMFGKWSKRAQTLQTELFMRLRFVWMFGGPVQKFCYASQPQFA